MQTFETLGLGPDILLALSELGYEVPSLIQQQSIPILRSGKDLIAQAQTGTGKTAAFALPILMQLDIAIVKQQALVLVPTRELAIQVAESFQHYAKHISGFRVLPIYGGQDFRVQLKALKRGVHVVVGTPGRIMDHLRRGSLSFDGIKTLVLDEADKMLQIGFIDDVKHILQQIPQKHQTALFSATLPHSIQRIADQYFHQPYKIQIEPKVTTVTTIKQFYTVVSQSHKLEILTRLLEIEDFDAAIIFTRTKGTSFELAKKLEACSYAVAAINGDMNQALREKVVKQIKQGSIDIVVATDVAARGLDIVRISHVINYDIPQDPESYVHRIGRTGRAGREGKTLLFVTPQEQRILRTIERTTGQSMKRMEPPSNAQISKKRLEKLSSKAIEIYHQASGDNRELNFYRNLIENIVHISECNIIDAAAIACLAQKESSPKSKQSDQILLSNVQMQKSKDSVRHHSKPKVKRTGHPSMMTQCRIELGLKQGLKAIDIVKICTTKAKMTSSSIGQIKIYKNYTLVDLPSNNINKTIKLINQQRLGKELISIRVGEKPHS